MFGDRIRASIEQFGPLCAGIDPSSEMLQKWGLEDSEEGLKKFVSVALESCQGCVGVIKPQVAFFERFGAIGFQVLEGLLRDAKSCGILTIADAKRGDISSTGAAYGTAWLDTNSPLQADAMTALAYMAVGALEPIFEKAKANTKGVIVVAMSSNPEGRQIQTSLLQTGTQSVEVHVLEELSKRNDMTEGKLGHLGAVVGATRAPNGFEWSRLGGIYVAPGLGAQGATPMDLASLFYGAPSHSVLASSSRGLLSFGPVIGELRKEIKRLQSELQDAFAKSE